MYNTLEIFASMILCDDKFRLFRFFFQSPAGVMRLEAIQLSWHEEFLKLKWFLNIVFQWVEVLCFSDYNICIAFNL